MVDPTKISVIHHCSKPTSSIKVPNFIGLAIYYRYFVKIFDTISTPMTRLTWTKVPF